MRTDNRFLMTPEQEALLAKLYLITPVKELEVIFGKTFRQIQQKANRMGILRRTMYRGLREALLARAVEGYANPDITEYPIGRVRAMTDRLRVMGFLFVGKTTHLDARFFDTAEKAKAYADSIKPAVKAPRARQPRIIRHIHVAKPKPSRPGWGPDDPVRITSETKVTIAPTPARALWTNTHARF